MTFPWHQSSAAARTTAQSSVPATEPLTRAAAGSSRDVITSAVDWSPAQAKRETRDAWARVMLLLSAIRAESQRAQLLLPDNPAAYDVVLAMPGAKVRGEPGQWGETVVEAKVGELSVVATWVLQCTLESHRHVGSNPTTYARETRKDSGRCIRCGHLIAPSFDPGEVQP